MHGKIHKRPSAALVVAMVALFVALGGTAGAVVNAAVPLAKRALSADNAKKLNGLTAKQIATVGAQAGAELSKDIPGPASTAQGLVVIKTAAVGQVPTGQFKEGSLACDSGQKVMGGGLSSDGAVVMVDSYPSNDTTWATSGVNLGAGTANISIWVTCLK